MANQLIFNSVSERWVNRQTLDEASGVSAMVDNRFFGYQPSSANVFGEYSYFDLTGRFVLVYTGDNPVGMDAIYPALIRLPGVYTAQTHYIPDIDSPSAAPFPTRPSLAHVFDYAVQAWMLPVNAKQVAADAKIRLMQDTIYMMQREPVTSVKSDDLYSTSLYFATDHFRSMLANPERIGIDGMGGVRFWGADGFDHTVGVGWFDNFNPLVEIYARDKLLDTQLYEARSTVLAMVDDELYDITDIVDYDPAFTLPAYPYV